MPYYDFEKENYFSWYDIKCAMLALGLIILCIDVAIAATLYLLQP